jgi:DNA primase
VAPSGRASGRLDPRDPVTRLEKQALECMLQVPAELADGDADQLPETAFEMPAFRAIRQGIVAAGGMAVGSAMPVAEWVSAVREQVGLALSDLVTELAVTPLPVPSADAVGTYATSVVLRLAELDASRAVGSARSRMQRMVVTDPGYHEVFAELLAIEARHRALRDRLGGT